LQPNHRPGFPVCEGLGDLALAPENDGVKTLLSSLDDLAAVRHSARLASNPLRMPEKYNPKPWFL
ncbi:MAG TPA: hypothetical protein QF870_07965, partial [Nitrospinota bacterium]|nr:hypothetical protein [Nitrospinota bacterium]